MNNFVNKLLKQFKDEDFSVAEDGKSAAEFSKLLDTGAYALNAILSGSIYGGIPDTKRIMLGGETSVGKTFFALSLAKSFLEIYSNGVVVYFDTEAAVTKEMFAKRGIDPKRVMIAEPVTIQDFRTTALKIVAAHTEAGEEAPPMMFILDSLGNLSTNKEIEDSTEGKDTRDMTRAQLVRATFRTLTSKLAKRRIPLVILNHVYTVVGAYIPTQEFGGGGGAKYAADFMLMLSKKKAKDKENNVIGSILTAKNLKSRFTKTDLNVELLLNFETGLDRYYGLLPIAEEAGIFVKEGNKYIVSDGSKIFESAIIKTPSKYYTQEVLDKIDAWCKLNFVLGAGETEQEAETENELE